jgi:hypothetical protein
MRIIAEQDNTSRNRSEPDFAGQDEALAPRALVPFELDPHSVGEPNAQAQNSRKFVGVVELSIVADVEVVAVRKSIPYRVESLRATGVQRPTGAGCQWRPGGLAPHPVPTVPRQMHLPVPELR